MNLVRCQWFHVSRQTSQKKKWTKEEISSLQAWKYATDVIYGPLIESKKTRDTVATAKHKPVLAFSADDLKLNNCHAAAVFTTDSEIDIANLPCSVSRRVSFQTVSEGSVEILTSPAVINSFNSGTGNKNLKITKKTKTKVDASSKDEGDNIVFDSTSRDGTYGYTWVDSPVHQVPTEKSCMEENTVASFTKTGYTKRENVKETTEQIGHNVGDVCGVSDTQRENNSLVSELQTANNDTSEWNILSFPLFDSPLLPAEPASLSTRFPSVSAILKATMPPESQLALSRWEQRMIAELGEDGFKQYKAGQ